ncbi:MAG: hypothetical protein WC789_09440 [Lentisphaeria bacterium]
MSAKPKPKPKPAAKPWTGKGSWSRVSDPDRYRRNFERIDWGKKRNKRRET